MVATGPKGLIRAAGQTRVRPPTRSRGRAYAVCDCIRVHDACFRHAYGAPPARPAGNGSRHVHVSRVRSTHVGRRKRPSVVRAHCSQTHAHVVRCPTRPGALWLTLVPKLGYGLNVRLVDAHVVRWQVRSQDTCAHVSTAHPRSEKNVAQREKVKRGIPPLSPPQGGAATTTAKKRCACTWSRGDEHTTEGRVKVAHTPASGCMRRRRMLTEAPRAAQPQKRMEMPVERGLGGPWVWGRVRALHLRVVAPPRTWHRSGYRTGRPGYERSHASAHTSRRMR